MRKLKIFKLLNLLLLTSHFLLLTLIVGCSTKYTKTGEVKLVSEKVEDVNYTVSKVSDPTPQNPYLLFIKDRCEWSRNQDNKRRIQAKETDSTFYANFYFSFGYRCRTSFGLTG